MLIMAVWNKAARSRSYLGEVRIKVSDVFDDSSFKTLPRWYKLYLNEKDHCYVTGSVLLLFELIDKKKQTPEVKVENSGPTLVVSPPTVRDLSVESLALDPLGLRFKGWVDSLMVAEPNVLILTPNDQGFYGNASDLLEVSGSEFSDMESLEDDKKLSQKSSCSLPLRLIQKSQCELVESELTKSPDHLRAAPESDDSHSDYLSDTLSAGSYVSEGFSGSDSAMSEGEKKRKRRFRRKKHQTKYELRNRKVKGVMFLEILSCSDLPPLRNFTRTTFDMDPFVVVTFGKMTFRTSWQRHTLNPVYNERLAFEVMESERNFSVQFSVLDRDHFLFHDQVADVSIPIQNLVDIAVEEEPVNAETLNSATSDVDDVSLRQTSSNLPSPMYEPHEAILIADNGNLVMTKKKKKFVRRRYTTLYVDTSLFKTLNLKLALHKQSMAEKHSPTLKIRARFLTYDNLRRDFWRILLEQYDVNETPGRMDAIELTSFLDALGSQNSDEIVAGLFKKLNRPALGEVVTIDEIVELLEEHITSNKQDAEDKIFEIDRCPICCQKRFRKKGDLDIVTHVAICASKDWSIVNKILASNYATPQIASRRWYSKFLIKLTYGKYLLGSNSANILVQDRSTGIIMEEKMNVTVRLGIRLLYKGLDKAKSRRIRTLLRKLSVKQGAKFDSPQLTRDISSFIRFHKLDLSECVIKDPAEFKTFNDFFYRKLEPDARPVEAANEDGVAVSPADCRCTAFVTVDSATELWIKGRNFSLAKLFNGNFNDLDKTSLYNPSKCSVGIFRLAPQDYHRFHSPVAGTVGPMKYIEGEYYTVNPMAIRSDLDVYGENVRVIVPIYTEKFGTVILVGVGAMMVGSTIITVKEGQKIERGEEVGYFKFGGSTVLLLFDKERFLFDSDLLNNSKLCVETLVRVGQSIGHTPDIEEHKREHIEFSKQPKRFKLSLIRAITGGDLDDPGKLDTWESKNIKLNHRNIMDISGEESSENESDIYEELRDSEVLIDSN